MAQTSYPLPSAGSAVTDAQYETMVAGYAYDGLVGASPSDPALIYGDSSGLQVKVRASRAAVVRGYGWAVDAAGDTVGIGANSSGSTRIDLVVLRLDRSDWSVSVQVVAGTPGSGVPAATRAVGDTGVWELPLAEVTVTNGAAAIAAADVVTRAWYLSRTGSILCTSTSRPPGETGMYIVETDTVRGWLHNGTAFKPILEDSGWIDLQPTSPFWGVSVQPTIRRYNGMIHLRGGSLVRSAQLAGATESKLFDIPAAFGADRFSRTPAYQEGAHIGDVVVYEQGSGEGRGNQCWLLGHSDMTDGDFLGLPNINWPAATDAYWG